MMEQRHPTLFSNLYSGSTSTTGLQHSETTITIHIGHNKLVSGNTESDPTGADRTSSDPKLFNSVINYLLINDSVIYFFNSSSFFSFFFFGGGGVIMSI